MDVLHPALWVSDVEATRAFYTALGLTTSREVVEDDGVVNWFARGDCETEIQFREPPDGADTDAVGFDHVALAVDDAAAVVSLVAEDTAGGVERPPTTVETDAATYRIAFVTDPDGYRVELIETVD